MMYPQILGYVTRQGVVAVTERRSHMKASTRGDHKFLPSELEGTLQHLRGADKWAFGYAGLELEEGWTL